MAPVVDALGGRNGLRQIVLLTGQHGSLDGFFTGHACRTLDVPGLHALDFHGQRDAMRLAIGACLAALRPDLLLVHGDTTSALAGALAARDHGIAVAHVEAGLRSHDPDQPWPEESNRVTIDAIATLLFAPTETAAANLCAEPGVRGAIHITGNSGIDALHRASQAPPAPVPAGPRRRILVTCHRRENQGTSYAAVCEGLRRISDELPVELFYLLHTNPHLQAAAREELGTSANIRLHPPVSHDEAIALLRSSCALLTDSGGLQEDGAAVGVPVIVLRDVTERVEAPDNIVLAGTNPDAIVDHVHGLLMDETLYASMSVPSLAFGDGKTGPRIATIVETWLASGGMQPREGTAVDRQQQDRTS